MQHGWPALYTLLLWWLSTGVILYLNGLPRPTHKWTMAAATVLLALALVTVAATARHTGVADAYLSFTAALAVWAWQEVGFLLGYVTGPRRSACPAQARGWARAGHAVMAILYHELALVVLAGAVLALSWGQPNQVACWTFGVLWLMRLSAKLNVFLGVRNLNEQFLPDHLRYMHSYFRQRPGNAWFPVSVVVVTALAVVAWRQALQPGQGAFGTAAHSLVAMLLSLALLEHWFMVLPLPSDKLWTWGLRSRNAGTGAASDAPRRA